MTRDVRIVLLVGLIFIFLFGLVLGDRTLRLSEGTAARASAVPPPPVRPSPEMVAPRIASTDRSVLARRRPRAPAPGPARVTPAGGIAPARRGPSAPAPHAADRVLPSPLPLVARAPGTPAERASAPPAVRPRRQTYTVRPGDRLITIARALWGRENQGKYKLIYEANRDKLPDEHSLQVGQVLVIPPLPNASPARRPAAAASTAVRHYTEATLDELRRRLASGRVYEVRRGDRLTDIARRQMGSDSIATVRRLYQANRDRIADPDVLPIGLKLRIPD